MNTRPLLIIAALVQNTSGCSSKDAPAACNELASPAAVTVSVQSAAAAPAKSGGDIVDGQYLLTKATVYADAPTGTTAFPRTMSASFILSASTLQWVGSTDGEERRFSSSFSHSGYYIYTIESCPTDGSEDSYMYTASGAELRLYPDWASLTIPTTELVFTRR
ncbi:MAG TPA: hypothetical protein VIV60_24480 [Polyangiaceae bacterium]